MAMVLVFARKVMTMGVNYPAGALVPAGLFPEHKQRQLRNTGYIVDVDEDKVKVFPEAEEMVAPPTPALRRYLEASERFFECNSEMDAAALELKQAIETLAPEELEQLEEVDPRAAQNLETLLGADLISRIAELSDRRDHEHEEAQTAAEQSALGSIMQGETKAPPAAAQ